MPKTMTTTLVTLEYMAAKDAVKRVIPGSATELPNPYGLGFAASDDQLELAKLNWKSAENHRIFFGNFARKPIIVIIRKLTGFLMAIAALSGVLIPDHPLAHPTVMIFLWLPLLGLGVAPAIIAGERAISAMTLRSSLWKQGIFIDGITRDIMAEPGMDRIKAGLNDVRRNNAIATTLAATSLFCLIIAAGLEVGDLAYNFILLIAAATSLGFAFHTLITIDGVRSLGDNLPYLLLHSPTHHPTQLDTILGDLVLAHLDPDLTQAWKNWEQTLAKSLLKGVDPRQARERLLYLLHLNGRGDLTEEETLSELKEFIKPMKISSLLLDPESEFNWKQIQRLIHHARAWRREVFDLLDRLQNDLLSGSAVITRDNWRMDLALSPVSDGETGNLFIALNNQTENDRHLRVEVIVPGGMPESHVHRFELSSCPGPKTNVVLADPLVDDALDWMPKYLERGVILWIGVAWEKGTRGSRNVQVILRDDDETILSSRIIKTKIVTRDRQLSSQRLKRMLSARETGESLLPDKEILSSI